MQQGMTYNIDMVLCIDCTGSMHGILNSVKENALNFYPDLQNYMEKLGKVFDALRIKVIAYRDFYYDGDESLHETRFFDLPAEKKEFSDFVNKLNPDGGGDEPESGLEALALAIKSDWNKEAKKRRELVIFWTDASAHELELNTGSKPSNYPENIPGDFNGITDWWEGQEYMNDEAKRLLLFTPDTYPWTDIATHWTRALHYPSKAGNGLSDVDYEAILNLIAKSI